MKVSPRLFVAGLLVLAVVVALACSFRWLSSPPLTSREEQLLGTWEYFFPSVPGGPPVRWEWTFSSDRILSMGSSGIMSGRFTWRVEGDTLVIQQIKEGLANRVWGKPFAVERLDIISLTPTELSVENNHMPWLRSIVLTRVD